MDEEETHFPVLYGSKSLNTIGFIIQLASWEVIICLMFPVTYKLAEIIYIFLPFFTENITFQDVIGQTAPSLYIRKLQ